MKLLLCTLLLLCPLAVSAAPGSAHVPTSPVSAKAVALVQTLKRLADALRDKNATMRSVSVLVGSVKQQGSDSYDLTPTDANFSAGSVSVSSYARVSY